MLVCILTSKVGLPLLTVQCRTPAPPFVPAAPKSTDVSLLVLVTAVGVSKDLPSCASPLN